MGKCGSFIAVMEGNAGIWISLEKREGRGRGREGGGERVALHPLYLVWTIVACSLGMRLDHFVAMKCDMGMRLDHPLYLCRFSQHNGQKIAMIAAGDEFSLVIDERGIPWT